MKGNGSKKLQYRGEKSQDEKVGNDSEEEELLNLLSAAADLNAESRMLNAVPINFLEDLYSEKAIDNLGDNNGNPESNQAAQQEPEGQQQEPAQEQPEEPPEPELPPFLMNENRLDDDELAELRTEIATVIIAAKLLQYRKRGVPEDDLELIIIPHTAGGNFISRGAWFGAFVMLSVLVLFLLQMQYMTGFTTRGDVDITFDEVMYELLDIRQFDSHVQLCHKDFTHDTTSSNPFSTDGECDHGVLHIPAQRLLRDTELYPQSNRLMRLRQGVNLTWRMPCQTPNRALERHNGCSASEEAGFCTMEDIMCFRGVHDNIVQNWEVLDTLKFAKELIEQGNDHFDVYRAGKLEEKLPEVITRVRELLADVYSLHEIEPFAFRILAAGPMDGYGVDKRYPYLNQTTYKSWVKSSKKQNNLAKPSIPWPFRKEPIRDQCLLLSDMEADPNFSIYTSVFLSTGAGYDFRGGTTLFVDDDGGALGSNPRSKIQRGLVIDGSKGRVVVSTGGLENKRCRLPLREGVRTELQIWWDSSPSG